MIAPSCCAPHVPYGGGAPPLNDLLQATQNGQVRAIPLHKKGTSAAGRTRYKVVRCRCSDTSKNVQERSQVRPCRPLLNWDENGTPCIVCLPLLSLLICSQAQAAGGLSPVGRAFPRSHVFLSFFALLTRYQGKSDQQGLSMPGNARQCPASPRFLCLFSKLTKGALFGQTLGLSGG